MTSPAPLPGLDVRHLGVMDYRETLILQHQLVQARAEGEVGDTLLLVEHPSVITLGRRRSSVHNVVLPGDTPVVQIERGGDVTWHGPGQLVGYLILWLAPEERDLHQVLRRLEEALIGVLVGLGLPAERRQDFTGVWCRGRKLVSVGVAVRRWVTFHGFALNVDNDLGEFARINPCGLEAGIMASIASEGVVPPSSKLLRLRVGAAVASAFGLGRAD